MRGTLTVWGAMVFTATLVGGCQDKPPPEQTRTGEAPAAAATFKLRVEKAIGLEKIALSIDGKVVGQASKPHEYIDVELPAGELLSQKKGLVSLRVATTCGEEDDIPLEPAGLDTQEELRARRSHQKKFVEMRVSRDHPKFYVYVDNRGSKEASVRVGKIDIAVPSRGKASRVLYLGACDEARAVTTPAGSGKLEGTDPAAYLIDTIGQSCYRAVKLFYTPGGLRPPEDQPLDRSIVHRLPMAWVDHFLEPGPKTLSKEVIMREGKEVSGEQLLIRHAVRRAPCR